ncbi:MAG: flagellar basal body rod protein FlgB [Mariprofundaceae bacterium]|nr:flagellar basal body rod protein FlgB [Mariprofundaceae bacterium]
MMAQTLFGAGFLRLESAMAAREQAQTVYASNIANADTPNYKADTRSFADFFSEKRLDVASGHLLRTNARHLDASSSSSVLGGVFHHDTGALRMDGNTVDTRKEMTNMAENQMMHELNMQIIKGRLTGMANVIKAGSR